MFIVIERKLLRARNWNTKKIFFSSVILLFVIIIAIIGYLSLFGYETNKFNSLLENKIQSSLSNVTINIDKIKVKINIKNFNFFITTSEPTIKYHGNKIGIKKVIEDVVFVPMLQGKVSE